MAETDTALKSEEEQTQAAGEQSMAGSEKEKSQGHQGEGEDGWQAQGGKRQVAAASDSSSRDGSANQTPQANFKTSTGNNMATASQNSGPPTLDDLCNGGATSTPTTSLSAATLTPQMREEVRYMYIHEYADGLNKLFETQWYTTHGLERLFANYELCRLFADTLELFAKSHEYELTRQMPLRECKLVFDLMKLPRQVPYANSADVELQTLLGRLTAVECLITGRTQLSSPTSIGALQTKAEPRQSMFWKHLGDAISQSTLCEAHWGLPTVPYARENSREALVRMACVLDKIEARDFLYSGALIRHVGPPLFKSRSSQPADTGTTTTLHDFWTLGEREQTVVAKKFLEDVASGNGTTQVIMRLGGAIIRSWRYWSS